MLSVSRVDVQGDWQEVMTRKMGPKDAIQPLVRVFFLFVSFFYINSYIQVLYILEGLTGGYDEENWPKQHKRRIVWAISKKKKLFVFFYTYYPSNSFL